MKVIIVEDEQLAVEHLTILLERYDSTIEIAARLDSVQSTLQWLKQNPVPDLAFFDIQLADGLSFEIFEQLDVDCSIVFTTAYDEYALKAFKVNSIDYLLKPVDLEELSGAMEKYKRIRGTAASVVPDLQALQNALQMMQPEYKERFLVKVGQRLSSVPVQEVGYFFHENRLVWLMTQEGRKHAVDYSLEQLEGMLDPKRFFRINRKYILAYESITDVVVFSNSRLKISLQHETEPGEPVIVSRERVSDFKVWWGG